MDHTHSYIGLKTFITKFVHYFSWTDETLRVDLEEHSENMFSQIKERLNVKKDAEVIRYLIGQEYLRIQGETPN